MIETNVKGLHALKALNDDIKRFCTDISSDYE